MKEFRRVSRVSYKISNSLWILFEIAMRESFAALKPVSYYAWFKARLDRKPTRENGRLWLTDIILFNLIAIVPHEVRRYLRK